MPTGLSRVSQNNYKLKPNDHNEEPHRRIFLLSGLPAGGLQAIVPIENKRYILTFSHSFSLLTAVIVFLHEINWPVLGFFIAAVNIFTKDTKENKLYRTKEVDTQQS